MRSPRLLRLAGQIPAQLGDLPSLFQLNLSNNNLTGASCARVLVRPASTKMKLRALNLNSTVTFVYTYQLEWRAKVWDRKFEDAGIISSEYTIWSLGKGSTYQTI